MNITLEDAYKEAITALGEAIVTQRIMAAELQRVTSKLESLEKEKVDE